MIEEIIRIIEDKNNEPGVRIERDGVHFGCYASKGEKPVLILYKKGSEKVAAHVPFSEDAALNGFYSIKVKIDPSDYEYNFQIGDEIVTDPYARVICGRGAFGTKPNETIHALRAGIPSGRFNWKADRLPGLKYEDCVMYHLHVRGFTMQKNSGVRKKGTFAGLKEKIPYLKKIGINQVKLMPVYDFPEQFSLVQDPGKKKRTVVSVEPDSRKSYIPAPPEKYQMNYWGYGEGFYFAPKASYAFGKDPIVEMKEMIRAFHAEGIEVILEFCFTDETNIRTIIQCLEFWAEEYHIDGFSVIARGSVLEELARIPLFSSRKLIANWYPDAIRNHNKKMQNLLAESNDGFMNDCRQMLKGDEHSLAAFSYRIRNNAVNCAQINYITNHDGFTMADLVSYERKQNLSNGEMNHDGTDYNLSWNCGEEGPSKKKKIRELRMKQRKNAYAMMLFSQGTPMLLAGDEFGNSQEGNNNPYCQDNEITWLDWNRCRANAELIEFVSRAIAFRKKHQVLHQGKELRCTDYRSSGFPDLSFHGDRAWYGDFEQMHRYLGCLYSGDYAAGDDFLYIAYNFESVEQEFAIPNLPKEKEWHKVMDTSLKYSFLKEEDQEIMEHIKSFQVPARTIVVLEGR